MSSAKLMPESEEQVIDLEIQSDPDKAISEDQSSKSSGDISIQLEQEEAASEEGSVEHVIKKIESRISQ